MSYEETDVCQKPLMENIGLFATVNIFILCIIDNLTRKRFFCRKILAHRKNPNLE